MRSFLIKLHIRSGDWKNSPRTFVQVCTSFKPRQIFCIGYQYTRSKKHWNICWNIWFWNRNSTWELWPQGVYTGFATAYLRSSSQELRTRPTPLFIGRSYNFINLKYSSEATRNDKPTQKAKFMGPTWGPPGSYRPQIGPLLAPWTLLSGYLRNPQ